MTTYGSHRPDSQNKLFPRPARRRLPSVRPVANQNMLINSPLPAPFFEPLILHALQLFLVLHYSRAYSQPALHPAHARSLHMGLNNSKFFILLGTPEISQTCHGSLLPLRRVDAERASQTSNRYYFLPKASTPELTLRILPWCAYGIGPHPAKRASARSVDLDART